MKLPGKSLFAILAMLCLASTPVAFAADPAPAANHLRVAVVQFRSTEHLSDNVARMEARIAEAAQRGAQVVVFPECALTSDFERALRKVTKAELAAAEKAIMAACKQNGIEGIIGTPEIRSDDKMYNCALIVSPAGEVVARHYKVHLVGGDHAWDCQPGDDPSPVFPVGDAQCSVLICHDNRYPELTRLPVLAGARVVFYISKESPVALESKLVPYRAQVQARAVENGVYLVHANAPADEVNKGSHGQSRIVAPDGNIIKEASIFNEEVLYADLDLAEATAGNAENSLKIAPLSDWWREGLKHVRVIK